VAETGGQTPPGGEAVLEGGRRVKARLIDQFGPRREDCEDLVGFQGLLVCLCRGY
jgi:hypothetical protein